VGKEERELQIIQKFLGKRGGASTNIFFAVRRIGQNEIELFFRFGELSDRGEDVLHTHSNGIWRKACSLKILSQYGCVALGFFDANGGSCAAAEAFETQGARTREQFQDMGVLNA